MRLFCACWSRTVRGALRWLARGWGTSPPRTIACQYRTRRTTLSESQRPFLLSVPPSSRATSWSPVTRAKRLIRSSETWITGPTKGAGPDCRRPASFGHRVWQPSGFASDIAPAEAFRDHTRAGHHWRGYPPSQKFSRHGSANMLLVYDEACPDSQVQVTTDISKLVYAEE